MNANTSRSIRVALFFIFGAGLIWIVHDTFTAPNAYRENGYPIRAPFEDVKQLKAGSDVRLAGVSIGSVGDLRLEDGQAVAILSIEHNHRIPVDSVATITTAGLLGNNYVSIQAGNKYQYLNESDTIKTKEGADMNKIVEQLGEIGTKISGFLDDFSGKGEGSLLNNVNSMMEEARPKLNIILDNLSEITNQMTSAKGTMGKLLYEDSAHTELLAAAEAIKKAAEDAEIFFKEAGSVIKNFSTEGDGPLSFILNDRNAKAQLQDSIANVSAFTKRLNSTDSTLGKLISNDDLYNHAESILNKVSASVESVENSGPMTAVGIGASALF